MNISGSAWVDRQLRFVMTTRTGVVVFERAGFTERPPVGPAITGRRAAASGRGHRRTHTAEARAQRASLALRAHQLRVEGRTIREIAELIGVSKTTCGKWLTGVRPGGAEIFRPYIRVQVTTTPKEHQS